MSDPRALVIGGGPAGLMAAEELARAGHSVWIAEAKPSIGRKFLMAGKSGLNLTRDEPPAPLLSAYGEAADWLRPMILAFDAGAVQDWARGLGQELFTGSTGRVFPVAMKASPLLRAWLARLEGMGVQRRTRWRWTGWEAGDTVFETPEGRQVLRPEVTVLALGGASWRRLGSDGTWAGLLAQDGVELAPFAPSNVGVTVPWTDHMAPHIGAPLKGIALSAGDFRSRGEAVLSRHGLEGGGIYAISAGLRAGALLVIDLLPDLGADALLARLAGKRSKASLSGWLRKALHLPPAKIALLHECARGAGLAGLELAATLKGLTVPHTGLRPMDEAISTAGGVRHAALDAGLMLRARPGVFCAGEMLDWEAPTGGYLLTACLASGRWAGRAAAARLTG